MSQERFRKKSRVVTRAHPIVRGGKIVMNVHSGHVAFLPTCSLSHHSSCSFVLISLHWQCVIRASIHAATTFQSSEVTVLRRMVLAPSGRAKQHEECSSSLFLRSRNSISFVGSHVVQSAAWKQNLSSMLSP